MSATLPVTVEVLGVEVVNKGGLLALSNVRVSFDGVEIEIQGVQVRRHPDGRVTVDAPCYRCGDSRWLPAVVLPPELGQAVADAVVEQLRHPTTAHGLAH